ncbi:hypothetical protein BVC71_03875 [Marivivens niveibacter]|uniref:Glycosyl transferase family 2 n=1 Tax=Marivivens niveibacter TaxID=1930667 RepID=A0A251X2M6_9RHOB|nr:glycosyltransferase family 2 protein [Marivivens niveibacter]OUD10638.1 hypothetical protein BVC71_03875 [Marivivens niveibacter]
MAHQSTVLISTMKNEGPYLLEWLAYHKSIGVDSFLLFSNDCTDGTNLMLNRLDQMGVIRHHDNPQGPRMDPQRSAYSRANRTEWVREHDWALIVDADEFVNVKVGDHTLSALHDACGDADAISIPWRLMGSCDEKEFDPNRLVTERFTRGSTFDEPENGLVWGFKTLFRPQKFDYFGVHRPKLHKWEDMPEGQIKWVNASGKDMPHKVLKGGWRFGKDTLGYDYAQVNHYAIKSREDFLLKRLRGTANSKNKDRIDTDYWGKYDLNANEDASIQTAQIRAIMDDWLQDADLAALHRACIHASRLVLNYQLEVPEYREFVDTGKFPQNEKDK